MKIGLKKSASKNLAAQFFLLSVESKTVLAKYCL